MSAASTGARRALVLSVGEEILSGDIVDTNAAEIVRFLGECGIRARELRCVGDERARIAAALREAASGHELVIVTGGLGPTGDDLTREGLALALGDELVSDDVALADMRDLFERLRRPMTDANRVQALRPASATLLRNAMGTAPGLEARLGGARVFVMPGVPEEMRHILRDRVLPRLRALELIGTPPVVARVRAHGLAESEAGRRIAEFMGEGEDPAVGITVSRGILTVKASAWSAAARERLPALEREIRERLGHHVFGGGDDTLESVLVGLLTSRSLRLAVSESCTGGLVASLITRVPGASAVLLEGLVTYSNEAKIARLGVSPDTLRRHGAVSEEVAGEMALGAVRTSGADLACSTTGVAGPGGGTAEKPVGLVCFGVAMGAAVKTRRVHFHGDRETIQHRAAITALDLLRRAIVDAGV